VNLKAPANQPGLFSVGRKGAAHGLRWPKPQKAPLTTSIISENWLAALATERKENYVPFMF